MSIIFSSRKKLKKELEKQKKRGKDLKKFTKVLDLLATGKPLPECYKDHNLIGNFEGCRECHIEPDWLLIYTKEKNTIILERTGSHSDLFK